MTPAERALRQWTWLSRGLADDVRYYGRWMRQKAQKRIGHLYPHVADHGGDGGGTARS